MLLPPRRSASWAQRGSDVVALSPEVSQEQASLRRLSGVCPARRIIELAREAQRLKTTAPVLILPILFDAGRSIRVCVLPLQSFTLYGLCRI